MAGVVDKCKICGRELWDEETSWQRCPYCGGDRYPLSTHASTHSGGNPIQVSQDRPSWDALFMAMAFLVSCRSLDPDTKHGCIAADDDRDLLNMGYNGPPRNCPDELIPLTRPEKYRHMEHAEGNTVTNAARIGVSLKGSTFFVTGHPCEQCFGKIINSGVKKVVYGPVSSACIGDESRSAIELMNSRNQIPLVKYDDMKAVAAVLRSALAQVEKYAGAAL